MHYVKHTAPLPARRRPFVSWLFCLCALAQPLVAQEPAVDPQAIEQVPATSAESSKPVSNQTVGERLADQHRQLLHDLKGPPTALWLPVDGRQVLAFWQPDKSGKPSGAVLMLHDRGENPRRAATLRRLHEYLPNHGWATFSIELPTLPEAAVPPRATAPAPSVVTPPEESTDENPTEKAPVNESEVVHQEPDVAASADATGNSLPAEAISPSRQEVIDYIHRRIEAATAYLHQQGQYNLVLLGEGSSADWVLQHLDKAVPPPTVESTDKKSKGIIDRAFRAVILVNPRTPYGEAVDALPDGLLHPEIPTLDVFTDFHLEILADAENRRQKAKQKGYEHYIIRRLPPPNGATPEQSETLLTKAIRGFLQKYAQGVEMK